MIIDIAIIVLACTIGQKTIYTKARASNTRLKNLIMEEQ